MMVLSLATFKDKLTFRVSLNGKPIDGCKGDRELYVKTIDIIGPERIYNECSDLRIGDYPFPPVTNKSTAGKGGAFSKWSSDKRWIIPTGDKGSKMHVPMLLLIKERLGLDLEIEQI